MPPVFLGALLLETRTNIGAQVMRLPAQKAEIARRVWPGSGDGPGPPSYCGLLPPVAPKLVRTRRCRGAKPLACATAPRIPLDKQDTEALPSCLPLRTMAQREGRGNLSQATARWNRRRLVKGQARPRTPKKNKNKKKTQPDAVRRCSCTR